MLNRVHLLKSNKLKPLIDFKIKNLLLSRLISWNPRKKKQPIRYNLYIINIYAEIKKVIQKL